MCCLCSCSGSVLLPEDNDLNDFRDNFSYVTNDSFLEAQIVFSDVVLHMWKVTEQKSGKRSNNLQSRSKGCQESYTAYWPGTCFKYIGTALKTKVKNHF